MSEKIYISADELLHISYQLAANIMRQAFYPDFIVAIWRGGTPIGVAVQELMEYCGIKTDHIAIRTSSYRGIMDRDERQVRVHNLGYLIKNINSENRLLIVDDVFDTGKSIEALLDNIRREARLNTAHEIRIATPYYKPNRNLTDIEPDFYIKKIDFDHWLVFPHELCGLSKQEAIDNKPGLAKIFAQLPEKINETG